MKTIIFIHPHFTIMGGAGRFTLELGKRLSSKYKIITISQKVNQQTINNYPEISFYCINGPTTDSFLFWLLFPYWQLKTYLLLKKFSQKNTPIFVSVFPSNWLVFPLKNLLPTNKIYWFCQEPSAFIQDQKWIDAISHPIKKFIAKLLNPIFKAIDYSLAQVPFLLFANSKFSQKKILSIYNRNSDVIYPGIDIVSFKPIPYSQKENYILTVSRLTKFKNIDILIKAFSKITKINYRLKIVGNGEELVNLRKLCQELKIDNRVDFLTDISDKNIVNLFQKAKLFVLCSKDEPFGIVPIEAMACGTPAIVDNSGGPKETVLDGVTGKIININVETLAQTINEILSDSINLKEISLNARKQALKFEWTAGIRQLNCYLKK